MDHFIRSIFLIYLAHSIPASILGNIEQRDARSLDNTSGQDITSRQNVDWSFYVFTDQACEGVEEFIDGAGDQACTPFGLGVTQVNSYIKSFVEADCVVEFWTDTACGQMPVAFITDSEDLTCHATLLGWPAAAFQVQC
jgi:hypothetical protein